MNPIVSVITPTYNRAHLLPRVWASLLKQTEQRFQWIIIDDGSTDSTREVIGKLNDSRIVYVWQQNQGVNSARNRGEEEVLADYVIFLDSDDELLNETTLNEMVTEIQLTRPEIAAVSFTVTDSKNRKELSYIPEDRFEANYLDHVCEKISGEFFPIYRRDALSISRWPVFRGMEVLRHWRIAMKRPVILINRPARIYHTGETDSLTHFNSVINRTEDMRQGFKSLIFEHQNTWEKYCTCQVGRYNFYLAFYTILSISSYKAIFPAIKAFRYGNGYIRFKTILLLFAMPFPLSVRRNFFLIKKNLEGKFRIDLFKNNLSKSSF